jgi:hypothetical protein
VGKMKKLLLIAAILAIGTTAAAVSEGFSMNFGMMDSMYPGFITIEVNNDSGDTTGDNQVHIAKAANILRDKGRGWVDHTLTLVKVKVLEPIKIESEIDLLYTEAVRGDKMEIGDIGFRIKGEGPAEVTFKFAGQLFEDVKPGNSKATIKGHNGFFPVKTVALGGGAMTATQGVYLYGGQKEIEVDLYLDLTKISAGYKLGIILAEARYQ